MTNAQIAASVLAKFAERGIALERCAASATAIAGAVSSLPQDADHAGLIELSVRLYAEKM